MNVFATIAVAFNLAFAQPILSLLGRNPTFFVAHRARGSDLVLLAVGTSLLVPLVGAAIVLVIDRLNTHVGRAVWILAVGACAALLPAQMMRSAPLPGPATTVIAISIGVLFGYTVTQKALILRVARIMSPLALVVAGMFLFVSPASALLRSIDAAPSRIEIGNPSPIVMVIFDEFPVASLMDLNGDIDEHLFPNLARLARRATWFRNASPTHDFTDQSVPSILTGRLPDNESAPTYSIHPQNLFTLAGREGYEVDATEPVSDLCPEELCHRTSEGGSFAMRWRRLLSDLRYVGLHMVTPQDYAERLPPLDAGWADFAAAGPSKETTAVTKARARYRGKDRRDLFEEFIARVGQTSSRPTLRFMHSMLPHPAWQYLPDGTRYHETGSKPGQAQGRPWKGDQWLADLAYQRHLLQVGYVDTLVGDLVTAMEKASTYDRSMLILTSDHGAAFDADLSRRAARRETIGGIGSVPLFIKFPNQRSGGIDDRPATGADILPTILDALEVTGGWQTDGRSLLGPAGPAQRTLLTAKGERVAIDDQAKRLVASAKYELFDITGGLDLFAMGPYRNLVGQRAPRGLPLDPEMTIEVEAAETYRPFDPSITPTRTLLTATVRNPSRAPFFVAVTVNGRIRSVPRTLDHDDQRASLDAMIPLGALRRGRNEFRFYRIGRSGAPEAEIALAR